MFHKVHPKCETPYSKGMGTFLLKSIYYFSSYELLKFQICHMDVKETSK